MGGAVFLSRPVEFLEQFANDGQHLLGGIGGAVEPGGNPPPEGAIDDDVDPAAPMPSAGAVPPRPGARFVTAVRLLRMGAIRNIGAACVRHPQ